MVDPAPSYSHLRTEDFEQLCLWTGINAEPDSRVAAVARSVLQARLALQQVLAAEAETAASNANAEAARASARASRATARATWVLAGVTAILALIAIFH